MDEQERMAIRKAVGGRIRVCRKLLGLTQADLADRMGIRFQQIQKYESGTNEAATVRLFQLAKALEVPVQYFFEDLGDDEAGKQDDLAEGNILRIAREIADLPPSVRDHFLQLAGSISSELESN